MDDDCLRNLDAGGHVIGLHSYSHPTVMATLPVATQRLEYQQNLEHIQRVLGQAPLTVSHPCDSYSADTLGILGEMGVRLGFRANMSHAPILLILNIPAKITLTSCGRWGARESSSLYCQPAQAFWTDSRTRPGRRRTYRIAGMCHPFSRPHRGFLPQIGDHGTLFCICPGRGG